MVRPYFIIEVANSHGGDFDYIIELLETFSNYRRGYGIKFQPLHHDFIATKDYSHYNLYRKLHFNEIQWEEIIVEASKTKDVWLDIFDLYGIEILRNNILLINGIKFQSSVLYNFEVFQKLKEIDLSDKFLIINIAAQPIEDIDTIIQLLGNFINPKEILLEFGYQAYPTSLEDSGLSKLKIIRKNFNNRIVFADHVDGNSDEALNLPLAAWIFGADYIEKHVMLDTKETAYDHFSSLTPSRFKLMIEKIENYANMMNKGFINDKEIQYLNKTLMIPILKNSKKPGTLLNFKEDFIYRRTDKYGLNVKQIEQLQKEFHILNTEKSANTTLISEDFKKATIATIIAGRLKSSRLPKKALLPIGGIPSIELCIKNCLKFRHVNHTILATSDLPEDEELSEYTYKPEVIFHKGDPEDVIKRYLSIADKLKIDVIIRVTADMPFVSDIIVEKLLISHFETGADYTTAKRFSVGTSPEIINTSSLRKVKSYFKSANYSEYMTWYFQNNPEFFRLNFHELPKDLIRDYRLTLDYPEDLEMFNKLQLHFDENKVEFDIIKAFSFLDEHPEISSINSHLTLRYKTDQSLIDILNKATKIKN